MSPVALDLEQVKVDEVVEFIGTIREASHWTDEERQKVAIAALQANDWDVKMANTLIVTIYIDHVERVVQMAEMNPQPRCPK